MRRPWDVRSEDGLTWFPERGMGYYPVRTNGHPLYDQAYFDNYVRLAETEMGRALTAARLALVQRHCAGGEVIDVGIGAGAFVEARQKLTGVPTMGFDVNPVGVAWLVARDLYADPAVEAADAFTFWDSIEHIPDPAPLLPQAEFHFLSLPIFSGPDHVLRSKHFKPNEHCWYWTRGGLIGWFESYGFRCLEHNSMESLLGREDIETFVFQRAAPPAPQLPGNPS